MSLNPNISELQLTNSTTYSDLLGLQLGLPRLQGETTNAYVKRLEFAAALTRNHHYEGALNEINLQLGVEPVPYISVQLVDNQTISASIAGIVIGHNSSILATIPLLTFDADSMWDFRMLSAVTADINAVVSATLLVPDGPAMQIARQTNSLWSFAEPISGIRVQLAHTGVQVGSESFNQPVSAYTITEDGQLIFDVEPVSNTQITYNYIATPYNLVGAPVALIGFLDAEFPQVAETPNNALAYQVREFIQSIMLTDRSYWAE